MHELDQIDKAQVELIEMCRILWDKRMAPGIAKTPNPFKQGMGWGKLKVHVRILRYEIETRRPIKEA